MFGRGAKRDQQINEIEIWQSEKQRGPNGEEEKWTSKRDARGKNYNPLKDGPPDIGKASPKIETKFC